MASLCSPECSVCILHCLKSKVSASFAASHPPVSSAVRVRGALISLKLMGCSAWKRAPASGLPGETILRIMVPLRWKDSSPSGLCRELIAPRTVEWPKGGFVALRKAISPLVVGSGTLL